MFDVALSALLAATATPPPGLDPEWTSVPPLRGETQHFTRSVPNAPSDQLTVTMQLCQCQPVELFDLLSSNLLNDVPDAIVKRSTTNACGTTVQHIVITGVADTAQRRNLDVYAFRTSDSLVTITYTFTKPAPSARDEAAMAAVCPPQAVAS